MSTFVMFPPRLSNYVTLVSSHYSPALKEPIGESRLASRLVFHCKSGCAGRALSVRRADLTGKSEEEFEVTVVLSGDSSEPRVRYRPVSEHNVDPAGDADCTIGELGFEWECHRLRCPT